LEIKSPSGVSQRLSSDAPCRRRVAMEVAMSKGTAMKKEQKKPKKKR
jgi:hypothetical protein